MNNKIELLKDLSEGFSTQSKTSNQFWIVLITTSIISLTGNANANGKISLPFTLGNVDSYTFHFISIILISIVAIAYTSAMIQAIRTRMLIQKVFDQMSSADKIIGDVVDVRDFVDSILKPTYNRVAPISQFLLGKNQFRGENAQNDCIKFIGAVLYSLLKLTTFVFIYFVPFIAACTSYCFLIKNYTENLNWVFSINIIYPFILLALISLIVLFIGEVKYLVRVFNKINKDDD